MIKILMSLMFISIFLYAMVNIFKEMDRKALMSVVSIVAFVVLAGLFLSLFVLVF